MVKSVGNNSFKMAQPLQRSVALMPINKNEKGSDAHPDAKPGSDGIIHMEVKCYPCSNMGHYASKCLDKKPTNAEKELSGSDKVYDFLFKTLCHIQLNTSPKQMVYKNWILLNSKSTIQMFNNATLLTNIQHHPKGDTLIVFLNGGSQESLFVGPFGGINVWYNP